MNNKDFIQKLIEFKACEEAINFIQKHKYTLKQAWAKCERADWMLWLMYKMEFATQKERMLIICDCAATVLQYVPKGENRPRKAIEALKRYINEPTEINRVTRDDAWATMRAGVGVAAWAKSEIKADSAIETARQVICANTGDDAWMALRNAARDASWSAAESAIGAAMAIVAGDVPGAALVGVVVGAATRAATWAIGGDVATYAVWAAMKNAAKDTAWIQHGTVVWYAVRTATEPTARIVAHKKMCEMIREKIKPEARKWIR